MEYDSLFNHRSMYRISWPGLCWHTVCKRLKLGLTLTRRDPVCTTARGPVCIVAYESVCIAVNLAARISARIRIGDEAAKGEGIDSLTVRCLGRPTLPLDPGRRVFSLVTPWAQPAGELETVRTLSRTEINLFGRSISGKGLRPEDGSRSPSGNRGAGEFKKTQRLSLSTH